MSAPLSTVVLACMLTGAASASAQTAAADTADTVTELDSITVYGRQLGRIPGETATKSGTSVLETPYSVNIVPRELLDLRGVANIGQAAETISGVQRTMGFSGNQRFRIRGFQAISTLRDGFRQSVTQPEIDLQGVDSIEVLKGPASALYGRFEPGGVINFVSKQPQEAFHANAQLTAGSSEYARAGVDVTGPLNNSGTVLGRINLAYEDADSYRDGIDNRQVYVAPVLEWRPNARTSLLARMEYLKREAAFDRGLGNDPVFLHVPVSRSYGEDFMRINKEQWTGSVEFNRMLGEDWRLRLGAFWSDVKVPEEQFFNYGFPARVGSTVNRNLISYRERQKDVTTQAELYGTFTTGPLQHRVLIGVERNSDELAYLDGWISYGNGIDLYTPLRSGRPDTYVSTGDSRYEFQTTALYFQDEISLGRWRLLLGGRQEWVRALSFYTGGIDPAITRRDAPFSPRAGLTWRLAPDVSLYASWGRSFRIESDAGLLQRGTTPDPTRGEQFEVGIKSLLLEGRAEATLAAFDLRKHDAVVADPIDWNHVIQAGELRSRGIEAELSVRPYDPWTLVASYAYTEATIQEDSNPALIGNRLAGVPRHQASVWTSWSFEGTLRGLTLGGGLFHGSRQAGTTSNNLYLPGYTRLDINARFAFTPRVELLMNIDNVTNKRYFITGGFSQIYPQAPRQVRVSVTTRW
jgi:iron complex outermembrane receptor protein